MDVLVERVAGLDVGKAIVVVCVRTPGEGGRRASETRTFRTMSRSLQVMADWLVESGVTLAGMESTATSRGCSAGRAIDAVTAVSYYVYMSDMTATDAREHFSEALAASSREPVFITRHGKRVAALVTAEFYDRAIEALEDAEDIAAARAALDEDGPSIPWEVVKADLGLA
jgi:prevent-host-death family protein